METQRIVPLTARQFVLAIRFWIDLRGVRGDLISTILGQEPDMRAHDLRQLLDRQVLVEVSSDGARKSLRPGYPLVYLVEWFDKEGWRQLEKLLGCKVDMRRTYDLSAIAIHLSRKILLKGIQQLMGDRCRYIGETDQAWLIGEVNPGSSHDSAWGTYPRSPLSPNPGSKRMPRVRD